MRLAKSLHEWNSKGQHTAVIEQIHAQMNSICAKVPASDPAQSTYAGFPEDGLKLGRMHCADRLWVLPRA